MGLGCIWVGGSCHQSSSTNTNAVKTNKNVNTTQNRKTGEVDVAKFPVEEGDEFIVLATDGLWDVMSSEEAVEVGGCWCWGLWVGVDAWRDVAGRSIP